jgi:hypothetical protein
MTPPASPNLYKHQSVPRGERQPRRLAVLPVPSPATVMWQTSCASAASLSPTKPSARGAAHAATSAPISYGARGQATNDPSWLNPGGGVG